MTVMQLILISVTCTLISSAAYIVFIFFSLLGRLGRHNPQRTNLLWLSDYAIFNVDRVIWIVLVILQAMLT